MSREIIEQLRHSLMSGDAQKVKELIQSCLEKKLNPQEILDQGMVAAMSVIGEKFKNNLIFMPEVMLAARAMNAGLAVLDPILAQTGAEPKGKVVLGTVRGDLHDVGKNMVSMMFRGAGYAVFDIGVDVPEERFVAAVVEHRPDVLALSALLTMTIPQMQTTIAAVEEAGLRGQVIIMVGGAPVTQEFAIGIGADGWAPEAASAVSTANELIASRGGR